MNVWWLGGHLHDKRLEHIGTGQCDQKKIAKFL